MLFQNESSKKKIARPHLILSLRKQDNTLNLIFSRHKNFFFILIKKKKTSLFNVEKLMFGA